MRRLTITLTAALALAATPAVAVATSDLRSPDARDSARIVNELKVPSSLSSPDAKDSARHRATTYVPGITIHPTRPSVNTESGFHWGDAGLGAAGMLGLVAIVGGTLLAAGQRRRHRGFPVATG